MRLTADLHTHTVHSHGKGRVEDNVRAAISCGLKTVGIADHSVAHWLYGVKKRKLGYYLSCIDEAKKAFGSRIAVKSGLELNLTGLDGSVDKPDGIEFDILILGYHKAALCRNLNTAWTFATGRRFHHDKAITEGYMRAIQRHRIDIVAHPGYGVPVDIKRLAQACADYGTLFEINNKHGGLEPEDLNEAAGTGVTFIVSSDAHTPEHVGVAADAFALIKKAGIDPGRIVNITED